MLKLSYYSLAWLTIFICINSCSKEDSITQELPLATAANALENYLNNNDTTYNWTITEEQTLGASKIYNLLLTSQKWRDITWLHSLTIIVPSEVRHDGAMLLIEGGDLKNGIPSQNGANTLFTFLANEVAIENQAITAIIGQAPNQPLFGGLKEDALISHTLHSFKADGDYSWPLLFPMVKGVQKAMDAIEEFSIDTLDIEIKRFLLTGASKRGWTTWLTAAMDERVAAIAPVVIDVLNMPAHINYQLDVWGNYSPQIQDYVNLGIVQDLESGMSNELVQMIDPFSYREQLTMPKLIVIATNDEFWPVDAVKHYYEDLPGQNFLHYAANTGHDLNGGEEVLPAISAFFGRTLEREDYPQLDWRVDQSQGKIKLSVSINSEELVRANLWVANSMDRDFRDARFEKIDLELTQSELIEASIDYPNSGFRAFYLDLTYLDLNNKPYSISTRMFVIDRNQIL